MKRSNRRGTIYEQVAGQFEESVTGDYSLVARAIYWMFMLSIVGIDRALGRVRFVVRRLRRVPTLFRRK